MKIASYNVENLFDLKRDYHDYWEYIPYGKSGWNKRAYKVKLQNIAKVIKGIDADIIALEEIESLIALKDLRKTLKQKGLYYRYYKIASKKNTSVKVAILSKIPFVFTKEVSVTSTFKYRNILEAKFKVGSQVFYIFVNHWKAKSGAESRRIVSAKALINRVKRVGFDKNIILLGDFNSDYEEYKKFKRVRRLNDTFGKTGINHILKSMKQTSRVHITSYEPKNFYNLWYDVTDRHRYSYIYKGKKEALDNILISQPLLKTKGMYYKSSTMKAYKPLYLLKGNKIYRWQMQRKKGIKIHKAKGYSDHLAVEAQFYIQGN